MHLPSDTICALATAPGVGAIAVLRISGTKTFDVLNTLCVDKKWGELDSHTTHFARVKRNDGSIVDEVLITLFRNPKSFTGEDTAEISCHGSLYIQQELLSMLLNAGCRLAQAGEFTQRAYLNGKMDLSQAEAVADLIASSSAAEHRLAMSQMRGGFSKEINDLRQQLIDFAALVELELDFSEEDVEFADRSQLKTLIHTILALIEDLLSSFNYGNAVKSGVPVAIVGEPNVGKSTLLNALLRDDRAIVSDIAGTTRDTVEDEMVLGGYRFRFIDTAGLRQTEDSIEKMGIERSYAKASQAQIILLLIDAQSETPELLAERIEQLRQKSDIRSKTLIVVANKIDKTANASLDALRSVHPEIMGISAKNMQQIDLLEKALIACIENQPGSERDVVVTNVRHVEALKQTQSALLQALNGMDMRISGDFIAMDIRQALFHLGSITGAISVEDLLGSIFSRFCIGK